MSGEIEEIRNLRGSARPPLQQLDAYFHGEAPAKQEPMHSVIVAAAVIALGVNILGALLALTGSFETRGPVPTRGAVVLHLIPGYDALASVGDWLRAPAYAPAVKHRRRASAR